jgi:hypothetical protein
MFLQRFVKSSTGKILMSILLGLGLATLFRQSCSGKNCKVYKAPPFEDIENNVYKIDNQCYKFNKNNITCKSNRKTLDII